MRDYPRYHDDDRGPRPRRRRLSARPARKKPYLLLIVLALAGFCVLGCGGAYVAYFVFGVERTSDPAQVQAGLDSMASVQLPPGLAPHTKTVEATGVVTVEFRSASGRSYLIVTTGSLHTLRHSGSLRDSKDAGTRAGGGRPEKPAEERTITATVRGQPAEFIYRRYSTTETISGYFQGNQYPVHLEAELSLGEFARGAATTLVGSIR
jgi:hypothetical protein